jgi:predicted AlkP superfamily pyrophosphatase or phosphodiesterase
MCCAVGAGLRVVAVEGMRWPSTCATRRSRSPAPRRLRQHDDNVRANALAALAEGLPDVLWVAFHGIDDVGHNYGPDTPKIRQPLPGGCGGGDLLAALPSETLVILFADHGMHAVQEEGRLGNHGNSRARDMLVPVWVVQQ